MITTREQHRLATRQRVIAAARQRFVERGYAATTVRGIAEAAGVSAGTVMAVGDKNALLIEVFDAQIAALHAGSWYEGAAPTTTDAAAADRSTATERSAATGTCVDRLAALARPFVELFAVHADLARHYAAILVSGTHRSTLFAELADRLRQDFAAAIASPRGCAASADAPSRAASLYYAYVGVLFSTSATGAVDVREIEQELRRAFAACCRCSGAGRDGGDRGATANAEAAR